MFFENLALCAFQIENFHSGLSIKNISPEGFAVSYQMFGI